MKKLCVEIGILAMLSFPVLAGNLAAPFDNESTSILPKGINNPRIRSIWVDMTEKYNSSGSIEAQAAKLNKPVSWKQVVDGQDPSMRAIAAGSISTVCPTGSSCNQAVDGPGATTGSLSVNVNVVVPTWVRGITDRTVAIVAVPVYKIDVQADTGFAANAAYKQWLANMSSDPVQQNNINKNFVDPVNDKLTKMGYERLESTSASGIGDVKLGAKTEFYKTESNSMAVKSFLTLPTGSKPNANKVVDTATGDGAYSASSSLIWDHSFSDYLKTNMFGAINYQFGDRLERRVPLTADDSLSPDREIVDRKRGNQYTLGTSIQVGKSSRGVSSTLGYIYQHMEETSFSGSQYESARYRYLSSQHPSQTMHSAVAALNYSTIDFFREKTFAVPMSASISYSKVLSGASVPSSDVISSELLLFF